MILETAVEHEYGVSDGASQQGAARRQWPQLQVYPIHARFRKPPPLLDTSVSTRNSKMTTRYRRYSRSIQDRKLGKDPDRKKLGGVCAGFGRYLDVEPILIRIIALVALCIAPQITLLAYGIAYIVLDNHIT